MSKITKQDTNGAKPLLGTGELGYDNYPAGGDAGRVYVGTGSANIPQAKKAEVVAVDGKVDTHIDRIDNPHGTTKTQIGLGSVDNTADADKSVLSATKLTTARTLSLTGDVTGSVNFDGSANASITTTIAANSVALGTDTTGNYVASNTAGTGISVSGIAGEGWSPTIAIDSTVTTLTGAQTLTNKTLQDSTTFIVDNTDATKKIQFDVAGVTTGTTRTLTAPNVSGTLITTGDTGSVTSAMIAEGTIVNADISTAAAIADTKLATISTAGKVSNSATTANSSNFINTIVARDASGNFSAGAIIVNTADVDDYSQKVATTEFVKDVAITKTSLTTATIDNGIVRWDGGSANVQNSGVIIDDSGTIVFGRPSGLAAIDLNTTTPNGVCPAIRWGDTTNGQVAYIRAQHGRGLIFGRGWAFADLVLDTSGSLLLTSGTGGIGYGVGAGGTVTQLTSKSTDVTLNKPSGLITMHNAALAAGASVVFNINNSLFNVYNDVCLITPFHSLIDPSNYSIECIGNGTGASIRVKVKNISGSSLSHTVQFKFVIIKGAIS